MQRDPELKISNDEIGDAGPRFRACLILLIINSPLFISYLCSSVYLCSSAANSPRLPPPAAPASPAPPARPETARPAARGRGHGRLGRRCAAPPPASRWEG